MTYDDLPLRYRQYAEDRGWDMDRALVYWQQAKEYRTYCEKVVLYMAGQTTGTVSYHDMDRLMHLLRGTRIEQI